MALQPQHSRPWSGLPRLREHSPTALPAMSRFFTRFRQIRPDSRSPSMAEELSTGSNSDLVASWVHGWIDWRVNVADRAILNSSTRPGSRQGGLPHRQELGLLTADKKLHTLHHRYKSFSLEPINYGHQLYKGNMSSDGKQKGSDALKRR